MSDNQIIYLAGGCFWGVEKFIKKLHGVIDTKSGYANGDITNPTYQMVCSGEYSFVECVRVTYDPASISLKTLLSLFFKAIDPTSLNQQGNDKGVQYRSGIYYVKASEKDIIFDFINEIKDNYNKPLVIEVLPLNNFFLAEDYHQDYLIKNPNGYCHLGFETFKIADEYNASLNKNEDYR